MRPLFNPIIASRPAYAAIAGLALLCGFTAPAAAQKGKGVWGPFDDLHVTMPLNGPCGEFQVPTPTYNPRHLADWIAVLCHYPDPQARVRGVLYYSAPDENLTRGTALITTIFGVDLNPNGADPVITGYDPVNPAISYDGMQMVGRSRKTYNASSGAPVPLSELAKYVGPGYDLSPFQGDPSSVVYVFKTTMPAKDVGEPAKGVILSEGFGLTFPSGIPDYNGAYGPGTVPGTSLTVTNGEVNILGVKNGTSGRCDANPTGNCLDLIGNTGAGAVQSIETFDLDPQYTYTVQFDAVAQDVDSDLHFTVALGSKQWDAVATANTKSHRVVLTYTPSAAEPLSELSFASGTNIDDQHGPVLSGLVLCAHPAGAANLKCPVLKP